MIKCPRRDLNPHSHYWLLDFKSSVSTYSTTWAFRKEIYDILSLMADLFRPYPLGETDTFSLVSDG